MTTGLLPIKFATLGGRLIALVFLLPALLLATGTAGYCLIEGWDAFDALYMTVTTLTTVGFGEIHPLSTAGRTFTMLLVMGGTFAVFYAGTELIRAVVTGELGSALERRRMEKQIANLQQHIVVCGFGRIGRHVCEELSRHRSPFVVIERDPQRLSGFAIAHGFPLLGDATNDEVLKEAGIDRARALVVVVATDADNLFVTMSARLLNRGIPIVVRAEEESSPHKLRRAGATQVVSLHAMAGVRVAQTVLHPTLVDLIEFASRREHLDLQIEELKVPVGGTFDGIVVRESGLRADGGLILVAIRRSDGHFEFNPGDQARLSHGDTVIVMGRRDQLDRAERLIRGN